MVCFGKIYVHAPSSKRRLSTDQVPRSRKNVDDIGAFNKIRNSGVLESYFMILMVVSSWILLVSFPAGGRYPALRMLSFVLYQFHHTSCYLMHLINLGCPSLLICTNLKHGVHSCVKTLPNYELIDRLIQLFVFGETHEQPHFHSQRKYSTCYQLVGVDITSLHMLYSFASLHLKIYECYHSASLLLITIIIDDLIYLRLVKLNYMHDHHERNLYSKSD